MNNNCFHCGEDLGYHHHRNLKCPTRETSFRRTRIPESFDAQVWAQEFVHLVEANPAIATDEGTMIGWFANALMRGYDEHYWRTKEYKRKMRRILVPWWKRLFVPLVLLAFAAIVTAQTFPRWPQGQQVRVYTLTAAFTDKEHARIKAALNNWQPQRPPSIILTLAGDVSEIQSCQGCVTLDRKPTRKDEWGECKMVHDLSTNIAVYSEISIDPRAGSGDDFQRVAEHEIGHVLGLDHRVKSVMSPHPKRGPSGDDGVILRGLYSAGLTALNVSKVSPLVNPDKTDDTCCLDERFKNSVDIRPTAQREAATMIALEQHGFTRTVSIQTLDANGAITGTYERISRMVLADNGERYEKVISKYSHLKDLRITKADEEDFSGAQMGLIEFGDYRFTQGNDGAIHVEPITLNGRKFSGDIWLGDKGIVRMVGTTLPERKERFPVVTVTRKLVDGHLFPSEASGKGVLVFPSISIKVRWSVQISDYYRFGSKVSIAEVEQ